MSQLELILWKKGDKFTYFNPDQITYHGKTCSISMNQKTRMDGTIYVKFDHRNGIESYVNANCLVPHTWKPGDKAIFLTRGNENHECSLIECLTIPDENDNPLKIWRVKSDFSGAIITVHQYQLSPIPTSQPKEDAKMKTEKISKFVVFQDGYTTIDKYVTLEEAEKSAQSKLKNNKNPVHIAKIISTGELAEPPMVWIRSEQYHEEK